MDNKITRRVVLGTGIAALAAGPFVMRALRKEPHDGYGYFSTYWRKCFDKSRCAQGDAISLSPIVVPNCAFDQCREVSYWGVHASFDGKIENVSAETLPSRFSEKVMRYISQSGELLCQDAIITGYAGLEQEKKEVPPHTVYVENDGKLLAIKQGDTPKVSLPNFDLPVAILDVLGTGLVFRPQVEKNGTGDSWVIPAGGFCECEVTCKVVGSERMLDRDSVVVETSHSSADFGRHPMLDIFRTHGSASIKRAVNMFSKLECRYYHKGTVSLDIETGLALASAWVNISQFRYTGTKECQTKTEYHVDLCRQIS